MKIYYLDDYRKKSAQEKQTPQEKERDEKIKRIKHSLEAIMALTQAARKEKRKELEGEK